MQLGLLLCLVNSSYASFGVCVAKTLSGYRNRFRNLGRNGQDFFSLGGSGWEEISNWKGMICISAVSLGVLAFLAWTPGLLAQAPHPLPASQMSALEDLYAATGGHQWYAEQGWTTAADDVGAWDPCGVGYPYFTKLPWYGVYCISDASGTNYVWCVVRSAREGPCTEVAQPPCRLVTF